MTIAQHRPLLVEARARTAYYARMNAGIFAVAAMVPLGRVTTFGAIAGLLNVPRHHVAFLLACSTDPQRCELPWYRVVGACGAVPWSEGDRHLIVQRDLLRREGIRIDGAGRILGFAQLFFQPTLRHVDS